MDFRLRTDPEAEAIALTEQLAIDAVQVAAQFNDEVIAQYRRMYENYWKIGRDFTVEQLQSRSDRIGPTELAILLNAGMFVAAMLQLSAPLEAKYHSPPFEYTIVDVTFQDGHSEPTTATFEQLYRLMLQHGQFVTGRLLLGEKISEWATV